METSRRRKVFIICLLVVSETEVLLILKNTQKTTYGVFFLSFVFSNSLYEVMKDEGERWT